MTPNLAPLARRQLRQSAMAVLQYLLNITVVSPGDWSVPPVKSPMLKVRCGADSKTSIAKAEPAFTTTCTLEILGQLLAQTAEDGQDQLEDLANRVEWTVCTFPAFLARLVQQIASIRTETSIRNEQGDGHVCEFMMRVDIETFEHFDPTILGDYPELKEILVNLDTVSPFDPGAGIVYRRFNVGDDVSRVLVVATGTSSGNYPNPPFPQVVVPAPRTMGPDGRNEGTLLIPLQ